MPDKFTNFETRPDVLAKSKAEFDAREQAQARMQAYQSRMPPMDLNSTPQPVQPRFTAKQVAQLEKMGITTLEQLQGLLGVLAHPATPPPGTSTPPYDRGITADKVRPYYGENDITNGKGKQVPATPYQPAYPLVSPPQPLGTRDTGYIDPVTNEWVDYAVPDVSQLANPAINRAVEHPPLPPAAIQHLQAMYNSRMPRH